MNNKRKNCNKQIIKTSMVWLGERAAHQTFGRQKTSGSSVREEQ